MTQQPETPDGPPALPVLKVDEPKVNAEDPWGDDKLDRKEIADRLTTIVRGQEAPFVISLDGRWGTGKTFLLKRWAQDLQNQDPPWQAIYYNAWEDDFANDPLLSVAGQLSEHFKKGALWAKARKLGRLVAPFVQPVASAASIATTGVPVPNIRSTKQTPPNHLADYLEKRAAKDELKKHLAELAGDVREATGQPLVFIIDELDRCRPTFAIELLERVKHIFDVPNIVFVFGINRGELVKALESVYGEIDAGTYLRRFFDMEFVLPDANPAAFCMHLIRRFGLDDFFSRVGTPGGVNTFQITAEYLPLILGGMGLSLRDMDYAVRILASAAPAMKRSDAFPASFLVLLAAVKVQNPALYRAFIDGEARGAEVLDCISDRSQLAGTDNLHTLEAIVYAVDDAGAVLEQLNLLNSGLEPARPQYLSRRARALKTPVGDTNPELEKLTSSVRRLSGDAARYRTTVGSMVRMIDLWDDSVRR